MESLEQFVRELAEELKAYEVAKQQEELLAVERFTAMEAIFAKALRQALEDTVDRFSDETFAEYAVINFIIRAHKQGYSTAEIAVFVEELKGEGEVLLEEGEASEVEAEELPLPEFPEAAENSN